MDVKFPKSELYHYGTPRHSGRYPWGSGEDPYQSLQRVGLGNVGAAPYLEKVREYRREGKSDVEIAALMGEKNTTALRARIMRERAEQDAEYRAKTIKLFTQEKWSKSAIARELGISEGTVRNYLKQTTNIRKEENDRIKEALREAVSQNKLIDVGLGVENNFGVTQTRLKNIIADLESSGEFKVHKVNVEQLGTGKNTTNYILAPADMTYGEVWKRRFEATLPFAYRDIEGTSYTKLKPPQNISSDRVMIRYGDEGGKEMDGVIQLRMGVEDISLDGNRYAQVRIGVDGTHYLKGMAIYTTDIPDGVDVIFNTNKSGINPETGKPYTKAEVLKKQDHDNMIPNNPFGASIYQKEYMGSDGKKHLSAINYVYEEGDWEKWSKNLPTQVLAKQPLSLIKERLDVTYKDYADGFDEIMSLTNPEVRRNLLESYAETCDSAATHMKAKAFPGQMTHVLLPATDMAPNEIYAPNYKDGTNVILIRYPHAGKFEIPSLTVNNRNAKAKVIFGNMRDAVGVNPAVFPQLSGADADGDSVVVIPNDGRIKTEKAYKELLDFDNKASYPQYPGMKVMTEKYKGIEMGRAANLIEDMQLQGAEPDEIIKAVKYSMVVIDAHKHKLNWKQAYKDFDIKGLREKYQLHEKDDGKESIGAATLISRARAPVDVLDRKPMSPDPETGEKRWRYTGATKIVKDSKTRFTDPHDPTWAKTREFVEDKKTGDMVEKDVWKKDVWKEVPKTTQSKRMKEVSDARKLITPGKETPQQTLYADYSNAMKALANQCRKEYLKIETYKVDPSAKATYAEEVAAIEAKLRLAGSNSPYEREAQRVANMKSALIFEANPDIRNSKDKKKKIRNQALKEARDTVGAKKKQITLTTKEWEAIQARAISATKLRQILRNSDSERIKELALPRQSTSLTPSDLARARAMFNRPNPLSQAEVAQALGVSVSTLMNAIK